MSGDVSSTDVVSSGFGTPWGFGFGGDRLTSLKPAEVALISTNNPFATNVSIRDSIAHESLRHEIKSNGTQVAEMRLELAREAAARQQAQIDELRMQVAAAQTAAAQGSVVSLLQQILGKLTTPPPTV